MCAMRLKIKGMPSLPKKPSYTLGQEWEKLPLTWKQKRFLKKFYAGKMPKNRGDASVIIDEIIAKRNEVWAYSFPDTDYFYGGLEDDDWGDRC